MVIGRVPVVDALAFMKLTVKTIAPLMQRVVREDPVRIEKVKRQWEKHQVKLGHPFNTWEEIFVKNINP